ncbi:MAG: phosphate ABC transporter permease subunit PstC, partial [Chloroflexi bacterium]|nr:phosphate ABC transporter permease subunit PstC [Chloroflexota bacterium]
MEKPSSQVRTARLPSRPLEFAIESLIRVLGFSAIGFVTLIFIFLLTEGLPAFLQVHPGNLFSTRWYPTFDLYGVLPLIAGSALVTVTAMFIAFPLGLFTAVFVREIAPNWAREILKPLIEVLAGIPS